MTILGFLPPKSGAARLCNVRSPRLQDLFFVFMYNIVREYAAQLIFRSLAGDDSRCFLSCERIGLHFLFVECFNILSQLSSPSANFVLAVSILYGSEWMGKINYLPLFGSGW
jgi:hypothetical protein